MNRISIGTCDISRQDIQNVVGALRAKDLSAGLTLNLCEQNIAGLYGREFCSLVNSGQSALEAALEAVKIDRKDNNLFVLLPATTYAATLWAVIRTGCTPVLCDIDENYNLDYEKAKQICDDSKIDVIMPVDLCGYSPDPPAWAKKYIIIRDACESFGNVDSSYADIICFSFYVSHIITGGSGGAVCSGKKKYIDIIRSLISHGRKFGGDFTKFTDKWYDRFKFDYVGMSYRADGMTAALISSQIGELPLIIEKRKRNALYLIKNQSEESKKHFKFPSLEYYYQCVFQFFPILITDPKINREDLLQYLYASGVDSRVLLSLTNQKAVKDADKTGEMRECSFPFSQVCNKKGFILGCHQKLNTKDMAYILSLLDEYVGEKNVR